MLRMILWFVLLAAIAALIAWLADRPGEIVINWLGYRIETSLAVAVLASSRCWPVLGLVWGVLRRLLHVPGAIADYVRIRRRRRGHEALSRGIVAVAAGDRDTARRHADLAARLLPGDPLARLLEAQTAQLRGDHARVERVFADMLADPDTEVVALRGLYGRARQAGKEAGARVRRARLSPPARPRLGLRRGAQGPCRRTATGRRCLPCSRRSGARAAGRGYRQAQARRRAHRPGARGRSVRCRRGARPGQQGAQARSRAGPGGRARGADRFRPRLSQARPQGRREGLGDQSPSRPRPGLCPRAPRRVDARPAGPHSHA
jgi:hypothetical protein